MFTFSFSTAFAGTFNETYSTTISDEYFETLWKQFVEDTAAMCYKDGASYGTWAIDKEVKSGLKAEAKAIYDAYMAETASAYVTDLAGLKTVLNWSWADGDSTKVAAFKLNLAAAQFAVDKAAALAKFATVPTYNYSTEEISSAVESYVEGVTSKVADDKTYQEAATMLVDFYVAEIEKLDDFNADVTVALYKEAAGKAAKFASDNLLPMAYATYATGSTTNATAVALTGAYDLVKPYGTVPAKTGALPTGVANYIDVNNDVNTWGTAKVAANQQITAANIAAVKAELAAQYAAYVTTNTTAADKTYADKWLKVANILAEEGKTALEIADPNGNAYADRANLIAKLEAYAARYGAELNADGELVRDAATVQKYLAAGIVAIAKADYAAVDATYAEYEAKIYGAQSEALAERLQYVKDSVNKAVELKLAALAGKYYAAEYAKVEAAAAKCTAAVEAATTEAKATAAYKTFTDAVAKIDTAKVLDENVTAAETALLDAAKAYVDYYNKNIATEATAELDSTKLAARIATMVGESGLRTQAEIKTLKEQAVAVAQGLPTKAEVTAAAKAIKAAVAAIPAKATTADVATLQAVAEAVKAYDKLSANAHGVSMTAYTTALGQIETAYNTQFAKSYATVDKKDAAAVTALATEIDAAADTIEKLEGVGAKATYLRDLEKLLGDALKTIKTNDAKAVVKLIEALPINITAADKEAVVAARAAYDAYVAKYTDIETYYGGDLEKGYASDDIEIAVLAAAETVLGLNDKSEEIAKMEAIAAIEGLKIKANSSAKKGSITVKWTVSEEVEGVKYQVYKSTKAQKGYKKSITTSKTSFKNTKNLTKGTRYFYKVRAIGEVDGVTYYSDWSNKANRIAK